MPAALRSKPPHQRSLGGITDRTQRMAPVEQRAEGGDDGGDYAIARPEANRGHHRQDAAEREFGAAKNRYAELVHGKADRTAQNGQCERSEKSGRDSIGAQPTLLIVNISLRFNRLPRVVSASRPRVFPYTSPGSISDDRRAVKYKNSLALGPCGPGAKKWGWAFVTRSFPAAHAWTRSLSRAVCFPTPLSAACGCLGLMAGPSGPCPVRIFRVRPLRPVRTLPAGSGAPDVVRTRLQYQSSRRAPLPRGRRQLLAGRWPRVTGLTSYLSGCFRSCSEVTCFCTPPHGGGLTNFARFARSPPPHCLFAPRPFNRAGPFGGVGPPDNATAFWSAQ